MDTLQVTDSEEIAHELLRRQVERSISDSSVVILNRNNGENRLEAVTRARRDHVAERIAWPKPNLDSCLAVRLGRQHYEAPERRPAVALRGLRRRRTEDDVRAAARGRRGHRARCWSSTGTRCSDQDAAVTPGVGLFGRAGAGQPAQPGVRRVPRRSPTPHRPPNKRAVTDTMKRMVAYALAYGRSADRDCAGSGPFQGAQRQPTATRPAMMSWPLSARRSPRPSAPATSWGATAARSSSCSARHRRGQCACGGRQNSQRDLRDRRAKRRPGHNRQHRDRVDS